MARFIFDPIHLHPKTGDFLPTVFSQSADEGCSIQRESIASKKEVGEFVRSFLVRKPNRVWIGVLIASCETVRAIKVSGELQRAVCVYDTAEPHNTSHAELFHAYAVPEADVIEVRRLLFAAFGEGKIVQPQAYRRGAVWGLLPAELQARKPVRK